ncbi:uncharacterized protein PHLOEM PROTEIN 2-LIKE A4-like isoform X3 [Rhodamnia argentea]|uniref:Uncharacterized protein PHLOEM PROTEIN 2-LIKE A4-like isoform X3 n=1 Tax=Rhodamnia argentea TaxID=178133 RepID=A0ABM3GXX2_9MYRT|nr:uncharacterized protein PHLOEM PROTEIN 2-LIKE A4-like isoform X3 [Rhodamnia argentea]
MITNCSGSTKFTTRIASCCLLKSCPSFGSILRSIGVGKMTRRRNDFISSLTSKLFRMWTLSYGGEVVVPMAELREVSWLQISGKFKTIQLSPKTTYEVAFVVKRIANSRGWYLPVNLNLTLPDKTTQGRMENLEKTPEGEWKHILVGTFVTTPENVGEISFSFSETGGHWKSGLLIKGVALRPKD